ncbi:DUF4476 domain-containing protein [Sanyastnella coralliicola]|uniref:DUF4476 domain-containing protein n=1 Tax=Sanyastnella coralliicola TaxID=3069118 RepID=UPI0027B8F7EB|nr:DUF4476 domain-containing protein [Longitalea sp. SCSIO 12813]
MKQLLLSTVFALAAIAASAQGATAIFFTEFGEKFTLYINGAKQNDTPQANVRVDGLTQEFFQVRVDFEDDMNADFAANGGAEKGMESTIMIKKNKKGRFVLRMNGVAPLGTTAPAEPMEKEYPVVPMEAPEERPVKETVVQETITTRPGTTETVTTTTTVKDDDDEVGISMKVGDEEVGISIKVPGMETMESETTVTETISTTTTTTTMTTEVETMDIEDQAITLPAPAPVEGPCASPMGDGEMDELKRSIEDKSFEDSKLTIAKQVTKAKCFTARQIKEIMMLFSFEDTKLEYAKFAYDYCFDQDNYYVVNDAFGFEMTIDELNEFLEGK